MGKILYIIQLPPPVYGVTTVNNLVYQSELINRSFDQRLLLKVDYSQSLSDLSKINCRKLMRLVSLSTSLLRILVQSRPKYAYYTIPPAGIGFYKEVFNIVLLKIFGVTPVFHLHGKGIGNASRKVIDRYLYNFCFSKSVVIHLSPGLVDSELGRLQLKSTNVYSVGNGVPTVFIEKKQRPDDFIQLLFLSNIQKSKGVFLLLDSFVELVKTQPKVRLNFVGGFRDAVTESQFHSQIEKLGLISFVHYHGELYDERKHQVIASCDIIVHPSYNDAYPLVLLEAMQHGLAVVASDQGAIPEIIDPAFGKVFPTGDKQALVNALTALTNNREVLRTMQKNAKKAFVERHTLRQFEARIASVFEEL